MKLYKYAALLAFAASLGQGISAAPVCNDDCQNIKQLVAVMGATMEGCDKAFPEAHGAYLSAFKGWDLLRYDIPGLADLLAENTPEIAQARPQVAQSFKSSPKEEQYIQCSGYGGQLKSQNLFVPVERLAPFKRRP